MDDVVLRIAQSSDAEALEGLEREAWSVESSPNPEYAGPVFGHRIPIEDVIVACSGTKLLGYVALGRRTPFASNSHIAVLRAIVVAHELQRRGIGHRLLLEAEQEARRRGYRALRLTVMGTNHRARALYLRSGWSELGRYPNEFRVGDGYVDDIFLGKDL